MKKNYQKSSRTLEELKEQYYRKLEIIENIYSNDLSDLELLGGELRKSLYDNESIDIADNLLDNTEYKKINYHLNFLKDIAVKHIEKRANLKLPNIYVGIISSDYMQANVEPYSENGGLILISEKLINFLVLSTEILVESTPKYIDNPDTIEVKKLDKEMKSYGCTINKDKCNLMIEELINKTCTDKFKNTKYAKSSCVINKHWLSSLVNTYLMFIIIHEIGHMMSLENMQLFEIQSDAYSDKQKEEFHCDILGAVMALEINLKTVKNKQLHALLVVAPIVFLELLVLFDFTIEGKAANSDHPSSMVRREMVQKAIEYHSCYQYRDYEKALNVLSQHTKNYISYRFNKTVVATANEMLGLGKNGQFVANFFNFPESNQSFHNMDIDFIPSKNKT